MPPFLLSMLCRSGFQGRQKALSWILRPRRDQAARFLFQFSPVFLHRTDHFGNPGVAFASAICWLWRRLCNGI